MHLVEKNFKKVVKLCKIIDLTCKKYYQLKYVL